MIIGRGALEVELKALAAKLHLDGKVAFLGRVEDDKMAAYYHSCDMFVLPSVARSEAFGIVQLEAMACGKPIINTDLPTGVPRISRNGETGITIPPADSSALAAAMNRMFHDSDFRKECGRNALARVATCFSAKQMIQDVCRVYEEVLE